MDYCSSLYNQTAYSYLIPEMIVILIVLQAIIFIIIIYLFLVLLLLRNKLNLK